MGNGGYAIVRVCGEEMTQIYPNFQLWREIALYNTDCSKQDVKSQKDSGQKDFPSHATLTPGLYLMTCGCSYKLVYRFFLLLSGESPEINAPLCAPTKHESGDAGSKPGLIIAELNIDGVETPFGFKIINTMVRLA